MKMKATTELAALALLLALPAPAAFASESKTAYSIDSAKSKIEIQVAKDGFFKAFGHDHVVTATKFSGDVQFAAAKVEASSVSFTAEANSLRVVDPGESEKDRNEVQTTMLGEQVLDVARYPQIQFSSSAVKVVSASKNTFDLQVSGPLTLHGTQKTVTLPVHLQISDDGSLTCDTEIPLLQSEFGMTPYKAAGGAVKVKDKLKLTFHIVATKAASSAN
jgi:polyisoprenoid-binding protein YceI